MDLSTAKRLVQDGTIGSAAELYRDLNRMLDNALEYNDEDEWMQDIVGEMRHSLNEEMVRALPPPCACPTSCG